jgi:hypothetical protein
MDDDYCYCDWDAPSMLREERRRANLLVNYQNCSSVVQGSI